MRRNSGEPSLFEILNRSKSGEPVAPSDEPRRSRGLFGRRSKGQRPAAPEPVSTEPVPQRIPSERSTGDRAAAEAVSSPGGTSATIVDEANTDEAKTHREAESELAPDREADRDETGSGGATSQEARGEADAEAPDDLQEAEAAADVSGLARPRPAEHPLPVRDLDELDAEHPFANRLPYLPATESEPAEPAKQDIWYWLNREASMRRATLILIVLLLGLVIAGAFLLGGGGQRSTQSVQAQLFLDSHDDPPWAPDPSLPPMRKQVIRNVETFSGDIEVPGGTTSNSSSDQIATKTYAIVVSRSTLMPNSERLAMHLQTVAESMGAPVGMDVVKKKDGDDMWRVYFGPFPTHADAKRYLPQIRRLAEFDRTKFSEVIIQSGSFKSQLEAAGSGRP